MASVSKVAANEPQSVTARAGGKAAPRTQAQAHPDNGLRSEGISIGVILGFPAEIAEELQRWRASFGDPMAGVVPAHITLVTTTMTQDWEATRNHVREIARRQKPFTVTIAGTGSFRPVSPVVFLNVEDGFGDCVNLHQQLRPGPWNATCNFVPPARDRGPRRRPGKPRRGRNGAQGLQGHVPGG